MIEFPTEIIMVWVISGLVLLSLAGCYPDMSRPPHDYHNYVEKAKRVYEENMATECKTISDTYNCKFSVRGTILSNGSGIYEVTPSKKKLRYESEYFIENGLGIEMFNLPESIKFNLKDFSYSDLDFDCQASCTSVRGRTYKDLSDEDLKTLFTDGNACVNYESIPGYYYGYDGVSSEDLCIERRYMIKMNYNDKDLLLELGKRGLLHKE